MIQIAPSNEVPHAHLHPVAFTLIELLVVIAITGIVAALIGPVATSAKYRSWVANCQSNERQTGIALVAYHDDFNHFPPLDVSYAPNAKGIAFWFDALEPYTSSKWGQGIMKCPAYKGVYSDGRQEGSPQEGYRTWHAWGSYSYNAIGAGSNPNRGLGNSSWPEHTYKGTRMDDIRSPSEMYAAGDSMLAYSQLTNRPVGLHYYMRKWPSLMIEPTQHPRGINMLFVDGHVRSISTNTLFSNDPHLKRYWNRDNTAE